MSDDYFDSIFSSPGKVREWWSPPVTYPQGTILYQQDARSTSVYFIERGLVKLTRIDEAGNEIIAGIRRRYWLIGAPAVLLKQPYSFNVTTLTECRLRVISAAGFLQIVRNDQKFYMELNRILSQEIYEQSKMLIFLGCMPARERLMQLMGDFINEMERPPDTVNQVRLKIPLKHKELAQMIAITPEHLSRLLSRMESEGFISREKNSIIVKKSTSFFNKAPI
jgi:CRP/FNR family cyclic AMP-dependent transcriptional regulator